MSVYLAHCGSLTELKKFNHIDGNDYFSIAEYRYRDDQNILLPFHHVHDEYEFVIPITTLPLLYYKKANYIGEVGFCYPINPEVDHGLEVDLNACHVISITVDKKYLDQRKATLGYKDRLFYTHFIIHQEFISVIRKIQSLFREEYRNIGMIETLINGVLDYVIKEGLASGEDNRKPEKIYAKNIKKILAYMYENYDNPDLDMATLANLCGYSVAYFSRSFKAFMNDPPVVHLNKLRLSEAKALFADKSLSLGQIATRVGYRNLSTFTEAFKKIIGMKPKQYRDKYY